MDIPEHFPRDFDRQHLEEILDEQDRLTALLARVIAFKNPNFGLTERAPFERALNKALNVNLEMLKNLSGSLKAGE